ncbi:hypothetical protein [Nostoc sp. FACHB-110]|uniref:hypothetical protein n=1 Tax=Nostoc sp. FACHB-110 TaxID=2692834 RepID=UPI00168A0C96|nr:hypothetical protein [Nostoc sp. FACHB-110]MBD2437661.1 hypothetical protein [Nostoc sp. FACHB-110]
MHLAPANGIRTPDASSRALPAQRSGSATQTKPLTLSPKGRRCANRYGVIIALAQAVATQERPPRIGDEECILTKQLNSWTNIARAKSSDRLLTQRN